MFKPLENLRLMTKVVIPTVVLLAVALAIVALAERSLGQLTAQTHWIIGVTATRQALALQADAAVNSVAADEKNAMLMTDKSGLDFFASAYVADLDRLNGAIAKLEALPLDAGEAGRLGTMKGLVAAYGGTGEQLYQFMLNRQFDEAHALSTGAAQAARGRLIALIREEVDQSTAKMQQAEGKADAQYQRTVHLLLGLSAGGLLGALVMIAWITNRFIVRPLTTMSAAMGRLSEGDLAIAIEGADRRDEIGVLARALTIFRDNAERLRAAHAEIGELNAVLEARVAARTAELEEAHATLLRKERLAALGQITATVAHELRNPLGVIRNSVALIDAAAAQAGLDLARPLGRVDRGIGRCDAIIADLLDFARIRGVERGPAVADDWLLDVLLEQTLPADVTLVRRLDAPGCEVSIDPDRMRRVVINLVENAAQAMADSAGERVITVSTAAAPGRWDLVIADTGPGVPAELLAKVFEPLFSTKSFGTGLGLPTVKQIVEQHDGTVELASVPGAGTRVAIRLPRRAADEMAA